MKKTKRRTFKKVFNNLLRGVEIAVFFCSIALFFIGLHNIDNAWNLKTINCKYNDTWHETTITGEVMTESNTYTAGLVQVFFAFVLYGNAFSCVIRGQR